MIEEKTQSTVINGKTSLPSPCLSVNWKAWTKRSVSSTERPTGKSLMVIWRKIPRESIMNKPRNAMPSSSFKTPYFAEDKQDKKQYIDATVKIETNLKFPLFCQQSMECSFCQDRLVCGSCWSWRKGRTMEQWEGVLTLRTRIFTKLNG